MHIKIKRQKCIHTFVTHLGPNPKHFMFIYGMQQIGMRKHTPIFRVFCVKQIEDEISIQEIHKSSLGVCLSERKFSSLFILWFLLLFFLNCIYLKSGHFCKFALMFFQWKNKRILFCPSSKIKAFCKSKKRD